MVDFHDPEVIAQDLCTYTFPAKHVTVTVLVSSASTEAIFRQWQSRSSGMPWVVSTCEYARASAHNVSGIINWPSASSWEFITTLDYEWSVIRRRRPYRWTIGVRNVFSRWVLFPGPEIRLICPFSIRQIYSVTRLATLMAVILSMFGFDITTPYNCQVCRG